MKERANNLTNYKNVDNEVMHNNISRLLLKTASWHTISCLAFVFFISSIFYVGFPNSFNISKLISNYSFEDFIMQFNVAFMNFIASGAIVSNLNILSKIKIPKLMDVRINGLIEYRKVLLISNTEEFYFFTSYDGSKEFAISKNQNIEIHRNYESIYKNEEPLKTKNHKSVIKT